MCEYCEKEKTENISGKLIKQMIVHSNKPLIENFNSTIQINLQPNGEYVLTDGLDAIKIIRCPVCGRDLTEREE